MMRPTIFKAYGVQAHFSTR